MKAVSESNKNNSVHVAAGMPPLDLAGRTTSLFEFWPMWLMYLPVVLQWLWLALRYRSLTLPLIANPAIPLSGMVGVPKSAVFEAAGPDARRWILPWLIYPVGTAPAVQQRQQVLEKLREARLGLPLVGKPDIGCRGAGVRLLRDESELEAYLEAFPRGAHIQFQQLSDWEAEAGVFYVRAPDAARGRITSLTLKYTPFVVGDGKRTLGELVSADARAGDLAHLYQQRLTGDWERVVAAGEAVRLVFSASHCRGAVFRDGAHLISDALRETLDRVFIDIPGFHYGRLDIKFRDVASLQAGRDFAIIEINGASAESINIWDRDAGLGSALATLLRQYRTLFKLGDANRQRGHKPPGILALIDAWRYESNLVKSYPPND